jgi:hypothetical protein
VKALGATGAPLRWLSSSFVILSASVSDLIV